MTPKLKPTPNSICRPVKHKVLSTDFGFLLFSGYLFLFVGNGAGEELSSDGPRLLGLARTGDNSRPGEYTTL